MTQDIQLDTILGEIKAFKNSDEAKGLKAYKKNMKKWVLILTEEKKLREREEKEHK